MRTVCLTGAMVVWAAAATAQAPQLADVLSRAAQYVATLESTLATVAVDEEYQQNAILWCGADALPELILLR